MRQLRAAGRARRAPVSCCLGSSSSYFLNHFPDDHGGIEPLRRLERSLMKREKESREKSRLGKESRGGKESREKEGANTHQESTSTQSSTPRRQILAE